MKVAHKNKVAIAAEADTGNELVTARQHERDGDNAKAIELYEKALKDFPSQANIYDRLLILYRKEKMYKKELVLLNKGIAAFTELFRPGRNSPSKKKVAALSKSILHSVGLTDKKGKSLYLPQPIARWEKRKKTVQQKLK